MTEVIGDNCGKESYSDEIEKQITSEAKKEAEKKLNE